MSVVIKRADSISKYSFISKNIVWTYFLFLACLDEVQEELLYYPGIGVGVGVSKMLKFLTLKFFM